MKIDLTYEHEYDINVFKGATCDGRFHGGRKSDFLISYREEKKLGFLVVPKAGEPWVGLASPGPFPSLSEANAVYACPNPRQFCVVYDGHALIMDCTGPSDFTLVPCIPVLDVKILPELGLLIFTDYTGMVAWGKRGLAWHTRPLAFNGLEVLYADENYIYGSTLDEEGPRPFASFQIDAKTGNAAGGYLAPRARITKTSVPVFDHSFVPIRKSAGAA